MTSFVHIFGVRNFESAYVKAVESSPLIGTVLFQVFQNFIVCLYEGSACNIGVAVRARMSVRRLWSHNRIVPVSWTQCNLHDFKQSIFAGFCTAG